MSGLTSETSYDDYLNEQLNHCINSQSLVIRTLKEYSRQISFQLTGIKNDVEILSHRVNSLNQTYMYNSVQRYLAPLLPPSIPLAFSQLGLPTFPALNASCLFNAPDATTFSFSTKPDEYASPSAPFIFVPICSNNVTTAPVDGDENLEESCKSTISLKPDDQLSSDEENDRMLYCDRAKLYRIDATTQEMKEREVGELTILQNKTTNQCRLLMLRDETFEICAHHLITSKMELKPFREKSKTYVWSAINLSKGVPKYETLCVKFKTKEQGVDFERAFNKAKEISQIVTDSVPSVQNISLNDDDIIVINELKPTAEQIERANKLQLPITFFLYENKPPCRGCRGCRDETQMNSYDAASLLENLSNFPFAFFSKSSIPSLMSVIPSSILNAVDSHSSSNLVPPPAKDSRMIIKAKRCLPSNRVPPPPLPTSSCSEDKELLQIEEADEPSRIHLHQKKTRNLSSNNFNSPSLENIATKLVQTVIDQEKQELSTMDELNVEQTKDPKLSDPSDSIQSVKENLTTTNSKTVIDAIFGSLAPIKPLNSGFSFPTFGTEKNSSSAAQVSLPSSPSTIVDSSSSNNTTPASGKPFLFGTMPKFSFSDLAKQSFEQKLTTTDDNTAQIFPEHGSSLFGSTVDTSDNHDDSYEPTVSFQPIVHLEPVEVRTGEEDENILFCERAKLYRFDTTANEMKERGIGPMKILQHKTTNQCRILMRRDQVFKICANHRIKPDMELKEHNEKPNTFIWSALDYADGQFKHETLCIKFKTADQARNFLQQFNDAKRINANL